MTKTNVNKKSNSWLCLAVIPKTAQITVKIKLLHVTSACVAINFLQYTGSSTIDCLISLALFWRGSFRNDAKSKEKFINKRINDAALHYGPQEQDINEENVRRTKQYHRFKHY